MTPMDEREIERLERLSLETNKCPYLERCCTPTFDQCYNHSHVLCGHFERFYIKDKEKKRWVVDTGRDE